MNGKHSTAFLTALIFQTLRQGYTNAGPKVFQVANLCTVAPNICWSLVWNCPYVTHRAPRDL